MNHYRFALLWASVLAAGVLIGSAPTADASLPPTANPVSVSGGAVTPNIDAAVRQYGAISGWVGSVATGGNVLDASVYAYSGSTVAGYGFADSTGNYQINGLRTGSYRVCVNGMDASGGGSPTGYLSRCYRTAAWDSVGAPPSTALPVSVTAGNKTPNINVRLPSAAAISGKVTNAGGTGLPGVRIVGKNRNNGRTFDASTNSTGSYKLTGLPAASNGYTVCFGGADAGATGYLDKCWKNVAWNGTTFPSTATAVSVTVGYTHLGIRATLPRGGAISGLVKDAKTGDVLPYISLAVFNSSGKILRSTVTDSEGAYRINGLRAALRDYVCVYPFTTRTATAQENYKGRCYKTVAWSGGALPSSGLTGVSVTQGSVHRNINIAMLKTTVALGSIAGTIRSGTAGNPVIGGASVTVYTAAGSYVGSYAPTASGFYKVTGLKANSTGYVVCARVGPYADTTPPQPATGWAPRCYPNANWDGSTKMPATATKVPLSAGQNKTGKNITLPVGGAISGTVTVFGSGNRATVAVDIFNSSTHRLVANDVSNIDSPRSYEVDGLASGFSYIVCFDGRSYRYNAATPYGSMPQCYDNKPWDGRP